MCVAVRSRYEKAKTVSNGADVVPSLPEPGGIGSNLKHLGLDNIVDFFFLLYFYSLILLHSGVN